MLLVLYLTATQQIYRASLMRGFFMPVISEESHVNQELIALVAFCLSLARALAVVLLAWFTLRWLDGRVGFTFKNWWDKADDQSKAIYLAARCFAVFLAFAICMA